MHRFPFFLKPSLHVQVKEPIVFSHLAFSWQLSVPVPHSSASSQNKIAGNLIDFIDRRGTRNLESFTVGWHLSVCSVKPENFHTGGQRLECYIYKTEVDWNDCMCSTHKHSLDFFSSTLIKNILRTGLSDLFLVTVMTYPHNLKVWLYIHSHKHIQRLLLCWYIGHDHHNYGHLFYIRQCLQQNDTETMRQIPSYLHIIGCIYLHPWRLTNLLHV